MLQYSKTAWELGQTNLFFSQISTRAFKISHRTHVLCDAVDQTQKQSETFYTAHTKKGRNWGRVCDNNCKTLTLLQSFKELGYNRNRNVRLSKVSKIQTLLSNPVYPIHTTFQIFSNWLQMEQWLLNSYFVRHGFSHHFH